MYQQFNNYGYTAYSQPKPIKCFPVSSYDEVKSAMINFDGSITVFTDLANGVIYTKGINIDGTAFINTYKLTQNPNVNSLEDRVIQLENALQEIKGGLSNAESNNGIDANVTDGTKSGSGITGNKRK